jgi:hypothetical protein
MLLIRSSMEGTIFQYEKTKKEEKYPTPLVTRQIIRPKRIGIERI